MKKTNKYTDGILFVCEAKDNKTEFGAVINVTKRSQLRKIVRLSYDEKSKREQDLEYCNKLGSELSLKVITPLCSMKINNNQKVMIDSMLYDIVYIDFDKKNREMYLYLQEVYELAE